MAPALGPEVLRILGTRVFRVEVSDPEEVTLVSDLHLVPDDRAKIAAFDALVASRPAGSKLLVLGDLFEFWTGRSQLRVPAWRGLIDILRRAGERGVRVYLFWGNRDFQLDRRFERATGTVVVPGGALLVAPDRTLLCLHGDELCQNDAGYQRAKRWLRSTPVRFLLHALPYSLTARMAAGARGQSRKAIAKTDPTRLFPSRRALASVRRSGTSELCFGHVHVASTGALPGDGEAGRYWILPSFESDDSGHAIWSAATGLQLYVNGERMPFDPGIRLGP